MIRNNVDVIQELTGNNQLLCCWVEAEAISAGVDDAQVIAVIAVKLNLCAKYRGCNLVVVFSNAKPRFSNRAS